MLAGIPQPGRATCCSSRYVCFFSRARVEDQDRAGRHDDLQQRDLDQPLAQPISWSMRTRGSVPRIQTKTKAKVNVSAMNQNSPDNDVKLCRQEQQTANRDDVEENEAKDQRDQERPATRASRLRALYRGSAAARRSDQQQQAQAQLRGRWPPG